VSRRDLYPLLGDRLIRPLGNALYRVRVHGADRIPRRGGCILAANHDSLLDPIILGLATTRPVRFMAKVELWSNPVIAWAMDGMGAFPVRRAAGDHEAAARGVALLQAGEVIGIFPQGTALPYRRRPYGRGAARLALVTGAPIVPVFLLHTERALRPGRPKVGFPRLHVLVARPIEVTPGKPTVARARALTRRVEEAIADLRRPYGPPAHAWID
jgi:1-acyl-sn-glycerol-3-phosphate acyltransferase